MKRLLVNSRVAVFAWQIILIFAIFFFGRITTIQAETMEIGAIPPGKIISLNGQKFVKVSADNLFMSLRPACYIEGTPVDWLAWNCPVTDLTARVNEAQAGDTLTLSKGLFSVPNDLGKSLNFVGIPGQSAIVKGGINYTRADTASFKHIIFSDSLFLFSLNGTNLTFDNCVFYNMRNYNALSNGSIVTSTYIANTNLTFNYCTFYGVTSSQFASFGSSGNIANLNNCIANSAYAITNYTGRVPWTLVNNASLSNRTTIDTATWKTTDPNVGVWSGPNAWTE